MVPDADGPVRERRKLSFAGMAVASMVFSRKGEILCEPELTLEGIPSTAANGEAMTEIVLDAIDGTLRSIPPARRKDLEMVRDAMYRAIRGSINDAWGKKPIVKVLLSVV